MKGMAAVFRIERVREMEGMVAVSRIERVRDGGNGCSVKD